MEFMMKKDGKSNNLIWFIKNKEKNYLNYLDKLLKFGNVFEV